MALRHLPLLEKNEVDEQTDERDDEDNKSRIGQDLAFVGISDGEQDGERTHLLILTSIPQAIFPA